MKQSKITIVIWFFIGSVFTATIGVVFSFFDYTWVVDNVDTWTYIILSGFVSAALLFPVSIFLVKTYINKGYKVFTDQIETSKEEFLEKSKNFSQYVGISIFEVINSISTRILDYFIRQKVVSLIVRTYLFIFIAILGSVGTVLLYKQNVLIKEQNKMLLKQYEGFITQMNTQVKRWESLDRVEFEAKKKALEGEIISVNRDVYAFSIDIASLEQILFPSIKHEKTIAVRIYDYWDLTAKNINIDDIQNELDFENAKLELERFRFFFTPVNDRIQVMRTYPKSQQTGIIEAMREMLEDIIKKSKANE